jgi:replication factor C subunit 2/4
MKPRCIDDLLISERIKKSLNSMIESRNIMNMIFYGPPGTGKTSCAKIIADAVKDNYATQILTRTTDYSQTKLIDWLKFYPTSRSICMNPKLLIIDDAEFLGSKELSVLRTVIDESAKNCKFIFTSNSLSFFDEPIISRVVVLDFHVSLKDIDIHQNKLLKIYKNKFAEVELQFDEKIIKDKIMTYFPDYRSIANAIDFELK